VPGSVNYNIAGLQPGGAGSGLPCHQNQDYSGWGGGWGKIALACARLAAKVGVEFFQPPEAAVFAFYPEPTYLIRESI